MSIELIEYDLVKEPAELTINITGVDSINQFKYMVNRAMHTWQNPSREMTEFAAKINGNYELVKDAYHPRPAPIKVYRCPECRKAPCECMFTHY